MFTNLRPVRLDVNTDAVKSFTKKLEVLHRSAFPNAVRGTLNGAAFDVKMRTMPQSAGATFTERRKNFFKATSKVVKATGWDVATMQASAGFFGKNQAVDDLEQQEHGGKISSRSFIPMDTARSGNSRTKLVRANARLSKIRKLVDARKAQGKNDAQKFVQSIAEAGAGGTVLSEHKGKTILWRVNSLKRKSDGKFRITPLYSFVKGRAVKIDKTQFMSKAGMKSAARLEALYIKEAQRQFKKAFG